MFPLGCVIKLFKISFTSSRHPRKNYIIALFKVPLNTKKLARSVTVPFGSNYSNTYGFSDEFDVTKNVLISVDLEFNDNNSEGVPYNVL